MKVWHFSELAYPSAWNELGNQLRNVVPNRLCDPRVAADLYHRGLDEWALCDELGLNIMVNEHHATATCMSAASNLVLAILARETKNVRLLGLGTPLANDPRVREAFELSIDREALNQVAWDGLYPPGCTPIPPISIFFDKSRKCPTRDVARAKKLLADAGLASGYAFELTIVNNPRERRVGEVIQQMAREVRAREQRLRAEVTQLRIEIDEARKTKQVAEITETDYFRDLEKRVGALKERARGRRGDAKEGS